MALSIELLNAYSSSCHSTVLNSKSPPLSEMEASISSRYGFVKVAVEKHNFFQLQLRENIFSIYQSYQETHHFPQLNVLLSLNSNGVVTVMKYSLKILNTFPLLLFHFYFDNFLLKSFSIFIEFS